MPRMGCQRSWLALSLVVALLTPLNSAPLFPDIDSDRWAADAVASLASKGLVEGYQNGTFKGDRAVSRWELAVVIGKLWQRMESAEARFVSKADQDLVRKLVDELRPELASLGVQLSGLEGDVSRLEHRISELERATFYGSLEARVVMQSFRNDGASDNDAGRLGTGSSGGVSYFNYNNLIGIGASAPLRPQIVGFLPPVDYARGVALTNGTGLTSRAILGLNIKVSPEWDTGLEFAAYASQGDAVVDAYWGVSAPFLSNPFTTTAGLPTSPYTRMTLHQFWMQHNRSKTKLLLGHVETTSMDSLIFVGQGNIGVYGPRRFPGYGFQIAGQTEFSPANSLKWEVLGTRFGNGVRFQDKDYSNYNLAGNTRYEFPNGGIGVFLSRMAEEHPNGGAALSLGLTNGINVGFGASNGWTIRQWVNTPGNYIHQLSSSVVGTLVTFPNSVDPRPISGWSATADNAVGVTAGAGNYGPQSQDTWGVTGHYQWPLSGRNRLRLEGRYAASDYRSSRNSEFRAKGGALDLNLTAVLLQGDLNLGAEYLRIDPNYQPAAWSGNVLGIRPVKPFNFTGTFHLFDSGRFPHNRTGWRINGDWKFHEGLGKLWAKGSFLKQTQTSLYNVRVTGGALGPFAPTQDVLGFAPGFVDTVFAGYAHPGLYGLKSRNSFTADLQVLEDPRGRERLWELGVSRRWDDLGLRLQASYAKNNLTRRSGLSASLGGSQNEVDMKIDSINFDAAYKLSNKWTVRAGADWVRAYGHFDPAGLYNGYALSTGETRFRNIDSQQWIPNLGFDFDLSEKSRWSLAAQHYGTRDHVSTSIQAGNASLGQIGSTLHPFHWSGWQVSSEFRFNF